MLVVAQPTAQADFDADRDLMRALISWHGKRHMQELALIEAYFDAAAFEEELVRAAGLLRATSRGCFAGQAGR